MSIGVAAHITAAAPGFGARRYDPSLTPEQRSSSANGIWLCQACGVIIDRDAVRFTAEALHLMKQEHTQFARLDTPVARDVAIIAVGPRIIAAGQVVRFGRQGASIRLSYFLEGSAADLSAFVHEFDKVQALERHVVVSETGYGRLLAEPPLIERDGIGYLLNFSWQTPVPRMDASKPIAGISAETGQMLTGIAYVAQHFERSLARARGTWFNDIYGGSHISELYWRFRESTWFSELIRTELIRLASIPTRALPDGSPSGRTPLAFVNRINRVAVPTFDLDDRRHLSIEIDAELEGITAQAAADHRARRSRHRRRAVDVGGTPATPQFSADSR